MDIPAPETRNCEECGKSLSLNLFRVNSQTCRYCESGSNPPRFLEYKQKPTSMSSINNTKLEIPIEESSKKLNNNEVIDQNNNKLITYELLIENYLAELTLVIGSSNRWKIPELDVNALQEYIQQKISGSQKANTILTSKINKDDLNSIEIIQSLDIDATMVKASIRTLLRSSLERREFFINFLKQTINDNNNKKEAIDTLSKDLFTDSKELGYPIPIMPILLAEEIRNMKDRNHGVENLTLKFAIREIATMINENILIFSRLHFENSLKQTLKTHYSEIDDQKFMSICEPKINSAINLAYKLFGIKLNPNNSTIELH